MADLLKPAPRTSVLNLTDCSARDTVFPTQIDARPFCSTNIKNGFSCQLAIAMFLASVSCAVFDAVSHIAGMRVPAEIACGVVGGIAVVMTAFQAVRSGAEKSFEDNRVNETSASAPQGNDKVSGILLPGRKNSAMDGTASAVYVGDRSLNRPDRSKATDFVQPFVSHDGQPAFFHVRPPIAKAPCDWCVAAARNTAFRSNPSHAGAFYG